MAQGPAQAVTNAWIGLLMEVAFDIACQRSNTDDAAHGRKGHADSSYPGTPAGGATNTALGADATFLAAVAAIETAMSALYAAHA